MKKELFFLATILSILLSACSVNQKAVQTQPQVENIIEEAILDPEVKILKRKVAIGRFSNETQYAKGIFYNKANDPITNQAADILSSKLASTNKFILLERQDLASLLDEMKTNGYGDVKNIGADYLIIGSVTEFGRKNTGDVKLFSNSKTQIVEAAVNLRLVDVATGQIIYSEEAKGSAETTNKTVIGFGGVADFDATLSDKAISTAISKLVESIINNCMDRPWKSYFLSADSDGTIISGGESQGIYVGDKFDVFTKGKKVKNPQTGMYIELPGKKIAKIKIDFTGGESVQNEFSMVSFIEGSIDASNLNLYQIKEIKE